MTSKTLQWLMNNVGYAGDGCLIWPFCRAKADGRGRMSHNGETAGAHRVMCILANGPPPSPDHEAAHSCGNGHLGCVHPGHLAWKTHAENMVDMAVHGRSQRGERHKKSILNREDVLAIRSMANSGMPQVNIARTFGCTDKAINHVLHGRSWAWLQ